MENSEILIVLFNLKKGVKAEEYEDFARHIDSPTIKKLNSNKGFTILKGLNLFGTNEPSPYQFIEIMVITSFEELAEDIMQSHVQAMLGKFMEFADDPQLIVTQKIV